MVSDPQLDIAVDWKMFLFMDTAATRDSGHLRDLFSHPAVEGQRPDKALNETARDTLRCVRSSFEGTQNSH